MDIKFRKRDGTEHSIGVHSSTSLHGCFRLAYQFGAVKILGIESTQVGRFLSYSFADRLINNRDTLAVKYLLEKASRRMVNAGDLHSAARLLIRLN